MRIPVIKGTIKRRLLVNFRADPAAVRRILPQPFRPKLHRGHSLVGICLIRLEQIRPAGLLLRTLDWRVRALSVSEVQSSFFGDRQRFPEGSTEFDHALLMRDLRHEWHKAEDLYAVSRAA